jgi:hypothetical protein
MILAASSLFVCLEFVGRHPGLLLVLIGVIGEIICDWKEMGTGRLARAKRISAVLLVVGLMMEFWEAAKSDNELADTKERTALVESNNLVLRSNVAALELQVMEAKTNIASIDPRNANISEISAIVFFTKMGMDLNELTNLPSGRASQLSLWKDERMGTVLDALTAANGDVSEYNPIFAFGKRDRRIYRMQFHFLNFQLAQGIEHPVKMLDDVHLVHIDLNFLPRDSEIGGASVELIIKQLPHQNKTTPIQIWVGGMDFLVGSWRQTASKVQKNNFYTCETEKPVSMPQFHAKSGFVKPRNR